MRRGWRQKSISTLSAHLESEDVEHPEYVPAHMNAHYDKKLSIIIPTHNRVDMLMRVLNEISAQIQASTHDYEVIVVNDHSEDRTDQMVSQVIKTASYALKYIALAKNSGPARARNVGIRESSGDRLLFIGDDVLPGENMLNRHFQWHEEHPRAEDALLGCVVWPEEIGPTAFMKWLYEGGRMYFFNYRDIDPGTSVPSIFFYTCNVSLKRELACRTAGFDESFPYASHEDIEFGYRLAQAGMRLQYDQEVMGYHWHMLDINGTFRRIMTMGYSTVHFWSKVNDDAPKLRRKLRYLFRRFIGGIPDRVALMFLRHCCRLGPDRAAPLRWHILLGVAFWKGMNRACQVKPLEEAIEYFSPPIKPPVWPSIG
jgi:glycosyltransferase involved in cell wall biosynthesis